MTPIQTHTVIQLTLSLLFLAISTIRQPSITLHQYRRAKILLRVPPITWARGRAACTENAFIETVELLAFFLALEIFFAVWWGRGRLEVRLDGFVLFIELCEIGDDIFYDVGVWERVNFGFGFGVCWNAAQASKCVDTINIHSTTPTNSLPTTPSESQGRINLVFDSDQSIQHHRARLVQIERVRLHAWLLAWLIGIPTVDVEGFDFSIGIVGWFFDSGSLGRRCYALGGGTAD